MKTRNKSILSLKENKNKSLSKSKKTKIIKRKETIKDASYRDQHNIGRRKSTSSVVTYSLDSRLFFDVYAKFNNENLPKDRNVYNGICNNINTDKKSSNSKIKSLSVVTSKRQINSEDDSCNSDTNSELSKKRKVNKTSYEAKPINSDEACIPSPKIPLVSPIKNNKVNKTFHSNENRVITRNIKPINRDNEKIIKNEVQLKPTTKNETFQRLLDNKTVFKKHLSQKITEKKSRPVRKSAKPVLSSPSSNNNDNSSRRRLSSRLNKSQNDTDSVLQSNDEQSISSNQQNNTNKQSNKSIIDSSESSPSKRGKRIASLNAAAIINCVQNLFNESPKRSPIKPNKRRTLKSDVNQSLPTIKDDKINRENLQKSNGKIDNCRITFEDIPLDINKSEDEEEKEKKKEEENIVVKRKKIRKKQIEKNSEEKLKAQVVVVVDREEKKLLSKKIEEKKSADKIEEKSEKNKKADEKIRKTEQNGGRKILVQEKSVKKIEEKIVVKNEEKSLRKFEEDIKIEKSTKKIEEKEKLVENHDKNCVEKSKSIIDVKRVPANQKRNNNNNNISRFFDITTKSNSKQQLQKDVVIATTQQQQINKKPKTFTVERVVKKRLKNVDECFEEFAKSSAIKKVKKNPHEKQVSISIEEEEDNGESFWEWEGESSRKSIQVQLVGELVERTCYSAIRHARDDVIIRTLDCVMLRSSADQEPFLAKIIVFYLDEETGKKMMTLLWYYRPEHTEQGRLEWHTESDVYASRHLDNNSVDCIEDKAFVLPVEIYSRFMAYQKRQSAGTRHGLAARLIPVNNDESIISEVDENKLDNCMDMFISNWYHTLNFQNSFPSEMTNSNVFVCRGLYDINQHKITRNILQNIQSPKLEPIDPCDSVDSAMSISSCESEQKGIELTVEIPSFVMVTEVETPLSDIPIPPTKIETVSNNCLPPISSFQHILPKPQTDTTVPVVKSCPPPPPSKPIQPPLPNTTNGDVTDCPKQPNGHP